MMINVLIADDHDLVRESVRALLQQRDNIRVVGEARNGQQVIELAQALRPNVVVMDIEMPRVDGLQALATLRRRLPRPRVVLLSMYVSPQLVRQAFRAGAHAYVLKQKSARELARAVYAAYDGQRFFSIEHDVVTPGHRKQALPTGRGA